MAVQTVVSSTDGYTVRFFGTKNVTRYTESGCQYHNCTHLNPCRTTGRMFYEFRGIPYAEPPIGDLRFKDPVAIAYRTKVIRSVYAKEEGRLCPQVRWERQQQQQSRGGLGRGLDNSLDLGDDGLYAVPPTASPTLAPGMGVFPGNRSEADDLVMGSEDCLTLSIFTPKLCPFANCTDEKLPVMVWLQAEGDNINFDTLMDEQRVVVVSVNSRLGPLGYLNLGNSEIPGNMGLRDQVWGF